MGFLQRLFQPSISKLRRSRDVGGLLQSLVGSDTDRRLKALAALRSLNETMPNTAPLIDLLGDRDLRARMAAAWTLMTLGYYEGKQSLERMVEDFDVRPEFRAAAAMIVEDDYYLSAVPRDLRITASTMLASIGHPLGFRTVISNLDRLDVSRPLDRLEIDMNVRILRSALNFGYADDDLRATLEQVLTKVR